MKKQKLWRKTPHKDYYPVEIVITQDPEVVFIKRGYQPIRCQGEAHTNAHIDHCMGCLNFLWGWRIEKIEGCPLHSQEVR